jgi:hypothetical protein
VAEDISRRHFLRSALRLAALGGIGVLASRLLRDRPGRESAQRSGLLGETCVDEGYCRGCSAFRGCGLPSALSARERAPWARGGG